MARYPGLSSEAFRHPLDRQAEQALRSVPGFDLLARKFIEFFSERPQYIYNLGNYVQVGPRQYSTIYQMFRDCVASLDVYPEPALFVAQSPIVNSYSLGKDKPYVVINSGLLDLLTETEIKTVLAHELGHVKCGHTVLILMGIWMRQIVTAISEATLGLGQLVSTGLLFAFYEWRRKAELSSDRAALLVMDELEIVQTTMMKVAGGSHKFNHELSLTEFGRQAEQYHQLDTDSLNQVYKFFLYNDLLSMVSHPFPVERFTFLAEWARSEELAQIKRGNYSPSREGVVDVAEEPAQSAEALRQQIRELQEEIDRIKGLR
jgi:Zn-dependent protease with chaperone function